MHSLFDNRLYLISNESRKSESSPFDRNCNAEVLTFPSPLPNFYTPRRRQERGRSAVSGKCACVYVCGAGCSKSKGYIVR